MKIPDSIQITVLDENPYIVYLILPKLPTQDSEIELSEAELEIDDGWDNIYSIYPCAPDSAAAAACVNQ